MLTFILGNRLKIKTCILPRKQRTTSLKIMKPHFHLVSLVKLSTKHSIDWTNSTGMSNSFNPTKIEVIYIFKPQKKRYIGKYAASRKRFNFGRHNIDVIKQATIAHLATGLIRTNDFSLTDSNALTYDPITTQNRTQKVEKAICSSGQNLTLSDP